MEASISKATLNDIEGIIKIHRESFKNFFLTSLGDNFLELYYSSFVNSKYGVVFCARRGDDIVGFSAASYWSHGFNSRLIKSNLLKFGVMAVMILFKHPFSLLRLVKNLNKETNDDSAEDDGLYAELYSIAVSPDCQGVGIGRSLLTMTEEDVREHNSRISLTTDYYKNEKTIAFYKALGYQEYYCFMAYPNRRMWRMIKSLR